MTSAVGVIPINPRTATASKPQLPASAERLVQPFDPDRFVDTCGGLFDFNAAFMPTTFDY